MRSNLRARLVEVFSVQFFPSVCLAGFDSGDLLLDLGAAVGSAGLGTALQAQDARFPSTADRPGW
jgi:hypothetical protein